MTCCLSVQSSQVTWLIIIAVYVIVQHCYKGDRLFQLEMPKIEPPNIPIPLFNTEIGTDDYVHHSCRSAKFG